MSVNTVRYTSEKATASFCDSRTALLGSTAPSHSAVCASARAAAAHPIKAKFPAKFAEFEQHKENLIKALRKATGGSFHEEFAWRALVSAAGCYFWRINNEKPAIKPARRVQRLSDLAKALHRAGSLVRKATTDDVGYDLLSAWYENADVPPKARVVYTAGTTRIPFAEKLKILMTELSELESAAKSAAHGISTQAGAPSGTGILTERDVVILQALYRRHTGKEPRLEAGPFADFVELFLCAVGQTANTSNGYVFEAFKYFKRKSRQAQQSGP
jgi:hypothetical protein